MWLKSFSNEQIERGGSDMREMKDSGIEWIGEIPCSWRMKRGKYLFNQRSSKGNAISLQLLSPTQKFGVIPQSLYEEKTGMNAVKLKDNADLSMLKTIHKGDFCISLRSFQGGFEYSEYEGVVSPAYQVFFPTANIERGFYKYLFKDCCFIEKMNSYTMTLRDGKNIAFSDFGNTYIPVPPLQEQKKIADFLDAKCAVIDALTADIQTQIDTLEQYKKSVITEAVTQGLNSDVEMKDSGVEWIGKIPSTWQVIRIKYLLAERNSRSVYGEEEPLSMSQKYGLIPTKEMDNVPHMAATNVGAKLAYIDDLVFNKLKAHLGVFSVSRYEGLVSPDYSVYFSKGNCNIKYLEYLFKTDLYINEFRKKVTGVGAGLSRLYTSGLFNIYAIYPPLFAQKEIVEYLTENINRANKTIDDKQKQLEILANYKKSIIYEYVTGKREVPDER